MTEIAIYRGLQESQDKFLRSRWRIGTAVLNEITLLIPAEPRRVALNFTIFDLHPLGDIRFGGPTGVNGILQWRISGDHRERHFSFNMDDEPALTTSDVWNNAIFNPVDFTSVEVWCCDEGFR